MLFLIAILGCVDYNAMNHEVDPIYIEPITDIFQYGSSVESATILLMLDTSCSMASMSGTMNDFDWVRMQAPSLILALDNLDIPWQIQINNCDFNLNLAPRIVNSDSTNPSQDLLTSLVQIEAQATQWEAGLQSSMELYQQFPELIPEAGDLHFIFVSDEDDQSPDVDPVDWLAWSSSLNNDDTRVTSTAIVGPQITSCGSAYGGRYISVADQALSICSKDNASWIQAIAPMEIHINEENKNSNMEFTLSRIPETNTIKVWVGEDKITPNSWVYAEPTNTIKIDIKPDYQLSIVVEYYERGQ